MKFLATISLREDRFSSDRPYKVDREKGILAGVKVLGEHSENGRKYPAKTRAAAKRLYEGIKVNIDHPAKRPDEPRTLESRFGQLKNIQDLPEGLFGDLHFNPKHRLADTVAWFAENQPDAIGLSHNADGVVIRKGDDAIVEEIRCVRHVDLVADPASTKGLFEGSSTSSARASATTVLRCGSALTPCSRLRSVPVGSSGQPRKPIRSPAVASVGAAAAVLLHSRVRV